MISRNGRNALALAGTLGAGLFIGQAMAQQPHMYAALNALETARTELQRALPNKGGHRLRAIALVNQAIEETNAGVRVGRGE
jgi:ribosomal protein L16/L10AE